MATPPTFTAGQVLTAAQMNAVGLWLVKTQTISSSTQQVTSCFTSDFANYFVTVNDVDASVTLDYTVQMLSGTTATAGTGYSYSILAGQYDTNAINYKRARATSSMLVGSGSSAGKTAFSFTILSPQKTEYTYFNNLNWIQGAAGNGGTGSGIHEVKTSYDGFQLGVSTGSMTTGTIKVYGYR